MKRTLTLLSLASFFSYAHAQCTDLPIPANAVVVSTSGPQVIFGGSVWVCGGVTTTIQGIGLTVYAESGANVTVNGNYCIGFAKGPGTFTSEGDTCFWSYEPTVTFSSFGSMNLGSPCDPITFDYSTAPLAGCPEASGVEEIASPVLHAEVAPNPADDRLRVVVEGGILQAAQVVDMNGREVLNASGDRAKEMDVHALPQGAYAVRIRTDKGLLTERFNKR